MAQLHCAYCGKEWGHGCRIAGDRCNIRLRGSEWCKGTLVDRSYDGGRAEGRREMLWLMAIGAEMLRWQRAGRAMSVSLVERHAAWQRDNALHALVSLGDDNARRMLGGE